MAVVGSTTAQIATQSWIPPFSALTSTAITYAGGPSTVPGSSTATTGYVISATNTGPVDPTVPPRANDHDYVDVYLTVHSLSAPSYRYAYFLWFVLIALFAIYAVAHQLGLRGGFLGSAWSRFAIRRRVLRLRKSKKDDVKGGAARSTVLPSNSQIICVVIVAVLAALVCVIGDDYINPYTSVWNLSTSFAKREAGTVYQNPSYNISKTWWTSGARFGLIAFALFPLVVLFALKAPPFAILAIRGLTEIHSDKLSILHRWTGRIIWLLTALHVALWTVQLFIDERGNGENRKVWFVVWIYSKFVWGVVGFVGMTGLIVLSIKSVRKRFYETFYALHIVLTIVTLLGSALHYPPLWYWIGIAAFLWVGERVYRFIRFGWINGWFGGMGRQVDLVAGPKFGDENDPAWRHEQEGEMHGMQDLRSAGGMPSGMSQGSMTTSISDPTIARYSKPLPRQPPDDFGHSQLPYHDDGSYDLSKYSRSTSCGQMSDLEQRLPEERDLPPTLNPYANPPGRYGAEEHKRGLSYLSNDTDSHKRGLSYPSNDTDSHRPTSLPIAPATIIPPGYAHAQLLPTKTTRLTIRVPKPFSWTAGQHVLLWVPEIGLFESHPFSILSTWDEDHETEVVLLVKARKGFTAKLYEETRRRVFAAAGVAVSKDKRQSLSSMMTVATPAAPPAVLYRVLLEGPFGSAARGRPGRQPSILLVCGGSGISFGISVLTYICECIASRDAGGMGRGGKGGRAFITSRVRLVWIVREFAEIAWVATMLKRCIEMVPREVLQIDIFVTDRKTGAPNIPTFHEGLYADGGDGNLLPPKPGFAQGGGDMPRRGSNDSIRSMMSQDQMSDTGFTEQPQAADDYFSATDSILDLTNYEDEEDESESFAQQKLSNNLKKEGKVRRARSRRARAGPSGAAARQHNQPSYPPAMMRSQSHALSASTEYTYVNQPESRSITPVPYNSSYSQPAPYDQPPHLPPRDLESALSPAYNDPYEAPTAQYAHRPRPSVASSITGSMYGRYDPFGGSGGGDGRYSPSPSMTPLDYDSRSIAGESTRPFTVRSTMGSRINSMVLVDGGSAAADGSGDAGIWLDAGDYKATSIIAEMARPGRPKLDSILREEIERSRGSVGVGTCGPASLNAVVRNTVSDHISLRKIVHGDRSGIITLFSEDYEN